MEILLLIVVVLAVFFLVRSKKSNGEEKPIDEVKNQFSETDQQRLNRLQTILNESTEIIDKTKKLDIAVSRYQLCREYLIDTQKDPVFNVINHDNAIDQLIENTVEALERIIIIQFNKDFEEAFDLKTNKGKANRYIKLVKYYQDNFSKIPEILLENDVTKDSLNTQLERLKSMRAEGSLETNTIIDAELEVPDWWKQDWIKKIE